MHFVWILPVALAVWIVWTYNRLVAQRNTVSEAWSGIDVQLKRRHDLVPNLASAVKGYSTHERTLFENISRRRSEAQASAGPVASAGPERELSAGLRQLIVLAEAYPELKASANFRKLSSSLIEIEDQIQFARRYFNGAVRDMNNLVESFPTFVVARLFRFSAPPFFTLESVLERQTPEVRL